jgi:hypothetical protein
VRIIGVVGLAMALAAWTPRARAQVADDEQARLGIDRVGSYLSYTWVDHAHSGWDLGAELDIGSVVTPAARIVLGLNYLHAEVNRRGALGPELSSSFHDFSPTADLRFTLFRWGRMEPFAGAGIGGHFLGNNIAGDAALSDRYEGAKLGAQFFGGTAVDLTSDRSWSAYAELRRIEVPVVARTTFRLGAFMRL